MLNVPLILTDGSILTAVFTAFLLITLKWRPRIWLHDFPPDIRAALPPKTPAERRLTAVVATPFLVLVFVGLAFSAARYGTEHGFVWAALHVYLVWQFFNLF